MAQQRNRKRKRRRRGRFRFLYKLLSIIIVIIALFVASIIFFRVNSVAVSGNSMYTEEEIIEASGVKTGDSLVTMNKYEIARNIRETLPYINEVTIRRSLPQTLVIQVNESGAVANMKIDGKTWYINYRGKVLGTTTSENHTAEITGLTGLNPSAGSALVVSDEESKKLEHLIELMTALYDNGLMDMVDEIDMSLDSRIDFVYDGRYTVKVYMNADFDKKMKALNEVLASERIGEEGTIDFTIEDMPHYIPAS